MNVPATADRAGKRLNTFDLAKLRRSSAAPVHDSGDAPGSQEASHDFIG